MIYSNITSKRNWKLIFETKNGHSYLRDIKSGIWKRKHLPEYEIVYVGSINPSSQTIDIENGMYFPDLLEHQLFEGKLEGFTKSFRKGFSPLGLEIMPSDILNCRLGILEIDGLFKNHRGASSIAIHVGTPIKKIYNTRHKSLDRL